MSIAKPQKRQSSSLQRWCKDKLFWLKYNYRDQNFQHILKRQLAAAYDELARVRGENEDIDSPICVAVEQELFKIRDKFSLGEREILRRKARFWSVYFPPLLEDGWYENLSPERGVKVLRPEREHSIRTQIFQKKITLLGWIFGAIFGFSSVIQAWFAVVSYYWPRH